MEQRIIDYIETLDGEDFQELYYDLLEDALPNILGILINTPSKHFSIHCNNK